MQHFRLLVRIFGCAFTVRLKTFQVSGAFTADYLLNVQKLSNCNSYFNGGLTGRGAAAYFGFKIQNSGLLEFCPLSFGEDGGEDEGNLQQYLMPSTFLPPVGLSVKWT